MKSSFETLDTPPWVITAKTLDSQLRSNTPPVLVDVREPEEFAEGYIRGAKLIPLDEITVRGSKELLSTSEIVLYCAHGIRSMHALLALQNAGFKNLRSLEGGIASWTECGLEVIR